MSVQKTTKRSPRKRQPAKSARPAKTEAKPTLLPCACGCRELVASKRSFKQGHDARLAGCATRVLKGKPEEGDTKMVQVAWKEQRERLTPHVRKLVEKAAA